MTAETPQDAGSRAPQLGALEAQVMELLWQQGPCSVRDVMDTLEQRPAYTTIATVMQNLQRKGLVRSQHQGRAVSYVPEVSREAHTAQMMRHALESSSDRAASILHFVKDMPDDELSMLRHYLDQSPTEEQEAS
ncbi:BlaI/MecI/CopY family transcriptional regulator [Garicola koreensis]|uniref:Putative transcriptional regulator n=1 Tax=Garicola koreensis TaxID=1262554 RepID=A0A7W5TUI6_9MICC|nr:BlaI/MecI/CopY family transcriptional regulator [Garicola koreensis]MBB3667089.1 putative transcriptional regulator [Garicola koreensis]